MMKKNYNNIENAYFFDTGKSGKILTIFGGIHGDEISGINASLRFINELENGNINLKSGKLIIVPKCNKDAIKKRKRYVNYNLNRLFFEGKKGNSYEEKRSVELMSILKKSDYFLDLHSTPGPSIPFLFSEINNLSLAKKLQISHIIGGWNELENSVIDGDTENYVNKNGGIGFTFEAGNHQHPDGEINSFNMILNFLSACGMISQEYTKKIGEGNNILKMEGLYIAKSDNFKFFIDLENFSKISKGTLIGTDNGEEVYAKDDMILVMPKEEDIIEKGVEVFFIGKSIG